MWKNINPTSPFQQLATEADILSRNHHANSETHLWVEYAFRLPRSTFNSRNLYNWLKIIRISTVIPLEIWDCPGNMTVETLGASLSRFSSLIFVIDIRVSRYHHHVRHQHWGHAGFIQPTDIETRRVYHCSISRKSGYQPRGVRAQSGEVTRWG